MIDLFGDLRGQDAERRVAERGLFFAESPGVLARLAESGAEIVAVLVSRRRAERLEAMPLGDADVTVLGDEDLYDLVGFEMHRGVIAAVRRPAPTRLAAIEGLPTIAVLEGIADHENLGAIVRSAAGLGVSALVLDPTTADPFSRRCVRVSMGTVAMIPIVRCAAWPGALETLSWATRVALSPAGEVELGAVERRGPVAVMLGAEGPGLSDAALGLADVRVRIRMERSLDSLNVAHAAAVAFYALRSGS